MQVFLERISQKSIKLLYIYTIQVIIEFFACFSGRLIVIVKLKHYFSKIQIEMKKKIKYYLATVLLFSSIVIYSQQKNVENVFDNNFAIVPSFDLRANDLLGSSYINEQFLAVKLINSDKTYLMRYNAYMDEIEFEKDGKLFYLTKAYNFSIIFESLNKIYQVFSYQENNRTKDGYFVALSKGDNISLLLQEKIKYFDEVKARSGYTKDKPAALKRIKDKLYIGYNNKTASELPIKKNELLKLFSSKSADIEVYAKKNNLDFRKNEDLIQMFNYYNTLN